MDTYGEGTMSTGTSMLMCPHRKKKSPRLGCAEV